MSTRFGWERAVKASDMPPTRKLVLLTLATHSNKGGKAWPSQARLAAECGVTDRTIRGHLAAAVEDGWLERTRKGQKVGRAPEKTQTSEYLLRIPNRNVASGSNESPTGTDVPVPDLQPEATRLQPEADDSPTGTGLPPISTRSTTKSIPLASPLSEDGPFDSGTEREAFEEEKPRAVIPLDLYEAAKRLGKQLATLTNDSVSVEDQFGADRRLRNYPELLHTVLTNWRTERIRVGLAYPEQVIR